MNTLQTGIFDAIYDAVGTAEIAEALRGTGNCEAKKLHRGPLALLMTGEKGRRDATLTVARYPSKPETLATENPSNGYAADFIGKVRIRGWLQLDQGIVGGGIANFEQLLALFPVGFRMQWHDENNIPTGWAIMDGTANSVGNGGSGIDRGGRVGYSYISGDPTFGTLGAAVAISLASSLSGDGTTVSTNTTGAHGHSVSGSEVAASIQISAHDDNNSTFPTTSVGSTLTVAPVNASLAAGSDFDALIWLQTNGTPAVAGHAHNVDEDEISAALTNHTVSTSGVAAETDSVGDHSHTSNINTIAGKLSIGTPTTVRPPGVVELWIEKLA